MMGFFHVFLPSVRDITSFASQEGLHKLLISHKLPVHDEFGGANSMPRGKKVTNMDIPSTMPPAASAEEREKMLISLAYNLLEKRLLDGSASSQEVTSIIKMGTMRERLERDNLMKKNELLTAQTEVARSQKNAEAAAQRAIDAIMRYRGGSQTEEDETIF